MLIKITFYVLIFTFIVSLSSAQTTNHAVKSPVAQRINEWVQSVNSGDWAAMKKHIHETYAGDYREYPVESHLQIMQDLYYKSRGLEIFNIKENSPYSAIAMLRNKVTEGWVQVVIEVEPEKPHGITRIGWGTADSPVETKATRTLSEAELVKELDAYFEKLSRADVYSGVVLLARNGKILYEKGFGESNKSYSAPNQMDTKFNLASIPKMFTAVAIAQLAEAGKLSFEDSVDKHLPELFPKEIGQKIKIKHLLSHTSGLGNTLDKLRDIPRLKQPRAVESYLEYIKDEKPAFEPGTKWRSSNAGFIILGRIFEKVSGKGYFRYIRENIFEPLGMQDTGFFDPEMVIKNQAIGYEK